MTFILTLAASFISSPTASGASDDYISPAFSLLPRQMLDTISPEERDAMEWLYANMPYPDAFAYSPEFFLANVRATLKARREMPWGAGVPKREWRHFVLPLRVNNEALDMARPVFFEELRGRVKGMNMEEAALEINHWAHEKATYRPSDARTSSPLSTVSQGIGRCGEESTLCVAAMRAMGIPARQIYTPRWAHTDDNHAWVEVWTDGRWHFLGACEPAPALDMAWFNEPASRGLIMSTDVMGRDYDGPEEVLSRQPLSTTINVTSNYAPTGRSRVRVVKPDGSPVAGAKVSFCVYNYAEFYPVTARTSDADGTAEIISGMGDMVAWASDGKRFGFAKVNPGMDAPATVVLEYGPGSRTSFDLDIVPPTAEAVLPSPSAEDVALNMRRLATEDSIRNESASRRFVSEEEARRCAADLDMAPDSLVVAMKEARGNGRNILELMKTLSSADRRKVIRILAAVEEKDCRDIPMDVILDNLPALTNEEDPWLDNYVGSPRVEWETLTAYKAALLESMPDSLAFAWLRDPASIAAWASENIAIDTDGNPSRLRMNPLSVWKARRADPRSRDIFCVGMLRSICIPARIDPVTAKAQFCTLGDTSRSWKDLEFSDKDDPENAAGNSSSRVTIVCSDRESRLIPRYYSRFSICRVDGQTPRQLEYPDDLAITDGRLDFDLDPGQYMLISGTRLSNGNVLVHGELFPVNAGDTDVAEIPLTFREDTKELSVIGSLNAENPYHDVDADIDRSILSATGRGYYIMILAAPGDEPTAHILNDISARRDEFDALGRSIVILFADEDSYRRFDHKAFPSLPKCVTFGIDTGGTSLRELSESLNLPSRALPIAVIADSFNRVVFASQGYAIGLPDTLLRPL